MNFLTSIEASSRFNVPIGSILNARKKGLIKSTDDKGKIVFNTEELENFFCKKPISKTHQVLFSQDQTDFFVVELFAGAGGLALGLKNSGLKNKLLLELDRDCCETLRSNLKGSLIECADIKNFSFKGIEADVVAGGFPCQSFSYAGKKTGFDDNRGLLFFEMLKAIKEIKPKIVLIENVKGLLKHNKGKTLLQITSSLKEVGYISERRVLRSQFLDVPQKRERLVIIGIRSDLKCTPIFPQEKNYVIPLKEALHNVPTSRGIKYSKTKKMVLDLVPEGGCWRDLPDGIKKEYMGKSYYLGGGKTGLARRLSLSEPSLTLTCSPCQKQTERCHPIETRPLTIREYSRIQCFPDEWEFSGSISSQYKQIGNAVPVNMGFHLGKCLIEMLQQIKE